MLCQIPCGWPLIFEGLSARAVDPSSDPLARATFSRKGRRTPSVRLRPARALVEGRNRFEARSRAMRPAPRAIAALILVLVSLSACSRAPQPQAALTPAAAPPSAPATPPAPAKHATMICRNSQDGRTVKCGTPNAVMVGIKED
jgi:hypothetical protein